MSDEKKQVDGQEQKTEVQAPESGESTEIVNASGGLNKKKLMLFGGIGLGAVLIIVVALILFMGGDSETPSTNDPSTEQSDTHAENTDQSELSHEENLSTHDDIQTEAEEDSHHPDDSHAEAKMNAQHAQAPVDIDLEGEMEIPEDEINIEELMDSDPSILEKIEDNLAFLDFEPEEDVYSLEEEEKITPEDSIEQVNWLDEANRKLVDREATIDKREKELVKLEQTINKKLLVLEQAETTRISKLAKLYDGMDSRAVAQLMANLDDGVIVAILPRMNIKNASAVLSLLPPKRAASLSKQMITIAEN